MRCGRVMLLMVAGAVCHGQVGARVQGNPLDRLAGPGTRAVVLFFVATDCPVSNREIPEMLRVRAKFAGQGVRFWFVYPNAMEKMAETRGHQAAFRAGNVGDTLVDADGRLVGLSQVSVTPEAAILVREGTGWRTVYHGRIDDRFVHIGVERPAATEFFVERGLGQLLAGETVTADAGTPVGCAIIPHAVARR